MGDELCNECKEFDYLMNGGLASSDVFVVCNHQKYKRDQKCSFCMNPESIINKETCCTGCSVLREKGKVD